MGVLLASASAGAVDALFAGSLATDFRYVSPPSDPQAFSRLSIDSVTLEASQKIVVELGNGVSFSVKACAGCHGLELDQAYGEVHAHRFFNLRAGRLNVPFGEFNARHDPRNFSAPSKPLPYAMGDMLYYSRQELNLGIVPAPWVDNGAEVFGSFALGERLSLDYTAFLVKGLAGDNDLDFASSRSYVDINRTPTLGGRLVLAGDDWAVGLSGSGGTYDAKDRFWYLMAGVEGYLRLGAWTFRAEALERRTDLDPDDPDYSVPLKDPWFLKLGWYAQVDWELSPKLLLLVRTDGLHRLGVPLPGSALGAALAGRDPNVATTPSVGVQRQTLGVLVRPSEHLAIKAGYELWTFSGLSYQRTHLGRVGLVLGY
ncbi:MAG: hypothetical protein ACOZIN_04285 [Myxococcota bacterium]